MIRVEGVSHTFGRTRVLRDVWFDVPALDLQRALAVDQRRRHAAKPPVTSFTSRRPSWRMTS